MKDKWLIEDYLPFAEIWSKPLRGLRIVAKKRKRHKTMQDIMQLCDTVRETAFSIHKYHKHGHLEGFANRRPSGLEAE